jgi:hypothetical protein
LRTVWIIGVWVLLVGAARYSGFDEELPLIGPPICLSAAAIWVLVIAWRPFRSGWRRLAVLTFAVPILYCCVGATFAAPYITQVQWRPIAITSSIVVATAIYFTGIWVAIQSVGLARTCSMGIIPEVGKNIAGDVLSADEGKIRRYKSARHALVCHDWIKSRKLVRNVFILAVVPTIIGVSLFLPLHVGVLVFVLVAFADFAAVAALGAGSTAQTASVMPPYVSTSPLRTATIAWSRMVAMLAIAAGIFFCILLVFAGWACWPENREIWFRWAEDRAATVGGPAVAFTVGVRWSVVIVFASAIVLLGRLAAYMWISLAGRTWVVMLMAVVSGTVYLTPVGVALRWFMAQTDWETTRISALSYLPLVPVFTAGFLVLKGIALIASVIAVTRQRVVTHSEVIRVVAIWSVITLLVSGAIMMLVPDPRVTFLWCLAVTSLVIPLSRVIVLPLALAWNRHR